MNRENRANIGGWKAVMQLVMTKTESRKPTVSWQQRKPKNHKMYIPEPPQQLVLGYFDISG